MGKVIVGSEAIRSGAVTRGQLRWNYRSIFPDVYVRKDLEVTVAVRSRGAYFWSRRRGVITGRAAAALHGARWIADTVPVEVIWANNHSPTGIVSRREPIAPGEITWHRGIPIANPARAALNIGRHLPRDEAVAHLDALARATGVQAADILELAQRYKGSRGVRRCRGAVELMDAGAESPQESRLRLILIDQGFPRPQTQIPVVDADDYVFARLDMGWQDLKIAVEYDGEHHRTDDTQYRKDARRIRGITAMGWIVIRVMKGDRAREIAAWVRGAIAQREREAMAVKMSA
ncbi:hypothetical protein PDG61_26370 [Mycolicibacterium sp. BiH015]|uniref:hypothetical protein n=1 Tax=Mycolicibacterium sp. BiH015 TaxID=3018808 RepID=UPI0022E65C66|nr:hypothetical protein [Mycolicibacterium sp. BiH015]MDA2894460.1 hypothetical protein [Mycolicibacterium sp. BiH015]